MSYLQQTKPAITSPISFQSFKDHLRVIGTEQDDYISTVLSVALKQVEVECGLCFMEQSWELRLDSFPVKNAGFSNEQSSAIKLKRLPLIKVDSLQYKDIAGVLQTWTDTLYQVTETQDSTEINPVYLETYPDTLCGIRNSVIVKFRAGYRSRITVDTGTDKVVYVNNPYVNGDIVYVGHRDVDGTNPTGLDELTPYYVINSLTNDFQLSLTEGGSAVDIQSTGSGELYVYKTDIPAPLLQAVKILGAHLYENRQTTIAGTTIASVPSLYDALVSPFKLVSF